jgi:hypothetical protein
MLKTLLSLALLSTILLFQGCSQKKYFEPEDTSSINLHVYDVESKITDFHPTGATLENQGFISKEGISKLSLDEGFKFLNQNDGIILSANDTGILQIINNGKKKNIQFEKNIISATIDKNLISYIMIDNSIGIYDLKTKKSVLKEYFTPSMLNDVRIASPIFLNSLILFPTLDGKIIIVDKAKKIIYKTINLDPKGKVNNIIYLNALGNTLIAATNNKVFTFANGITKTVSEDVRDIMANDKNIFVATLDGRIIKYDQSLNKLASQKFKFAKFYALAYGKKDLYALESQGYLIKSDSNLDKYTVYNFSFDDDDKVFSLKNKIYFEDSFIILK